MNPLVSIITPVRDGERWIAESIASVLEQTYEPVELTVVDDGSTDRSADIARGLGARVVEQPPKGQPVAMNTGVEASNGAFIGFIDADDKYPPSRIATMMSALLGSPEVEGVYGLMEEFAEVRTGPGRAVRAPAPSRHPNCMIVKRSLIERVGPFDETLEVAAGAAWVALAQASEARLVSIEEIVLLRRLHDSNMGLTRWDHRGEYARALHAGLVARRRSSDR